MPERMIVPNAEDLGEEIFLTPRVIDAATFEALATRLREIVSDSAQRVASLEELRSAVSEMGERVEGTAAKADEGVKLIDRRLAAIDDRIARAEAVLERAERQSASVERVRELVEGIEHRVEEAVAARVGEAERRLEAMINRAQSAKDQVERRVEAAQREAEQAGERAESTVTRLGDELDRRTSQIKQELAGSAGPIVTNLNLLCQRAMEFLGCDPRQGGASEETSYQPGSLGELVRRAQRESGALTESVDRAASLTEQARQADSALRESITQGAESADELETRIGAQVQAMRSTEREAARLVEQLELRVDRHREDIDALRSLDSEQLASRLAELGEQIERTVEAAGSLDRVRDDATAMVDSLDQIEKQEQRARGWVEQIVSHAAEASERAQRELERMRELLDSPAASLESQVGELNQWLGGLIDQARSAGERAGNSCERCEAAAARLEELSARLEPWRALTRSSDTMHEIPPEIREAIERVRSELEPELTRAQTLVDTLHRLNAAQATANDVAGELARVEPKPTPTEQASGENQNMVPGLASPPRIGVAFEGDPPNKNGTEQHLGGAGQNARTSDAQTRAPAAPKKKASAKKRSSTPKPKPKSEDPGTADKPDKPAGKPTKTGGRSRSGSRAATAGKPSDREGI